MSTTVLRVTTSVVVVLALAISGLAASTAAEQPPDGRGTARGTWQVTPATSGSYRLTWRSPTPLPVTDARPEFLLDEAPLGAPRLAADGRTLTLVVPAESTPDVAELDVRLSGRLLDGAEQPPADDEMVAPYTAPAPGRVAAVDPGEPGPHPVVEEDYVLGGLPVAGLPVPVEMAGHVVRPANAGASGPLVVFLHGRHQPCYVTGEPNGEEYVDWPCPGGESPVPSHLGYRYLQRLLASQGFVTVSVAANGINAQDYRVLDGGAAARAALVRAHLDAWARWAASGERAADLQQVVLVGHSRGGEGVNRAAVTTPLTAPYRIAGQVLLAPTDFGHQVAAYVPTVTALPYCDGDVTDLQGQRYTDLARDLTTGDTALRSSVLVMGANHNFFNTEWTPATATAPASDDGFGPLCRRGAETRLTAVEQRAVARAYVAGAVALFTEGRPQLLEMFDGSDVDVPSALGADVRTHMLAGGREDRAPGSTALLGPVDGATASICAGKAGPNLARICGANIDPWRTPHWIPGGAWNRGVPVTRAWQVAWSVSGASGSLRFPESLDLRGAPYLDVRTVVDPALGRVRLGVAVWDGSGNRQVLTPGGNGVLLPLPGRPYSDKLWAQPLRVPLPRGPGIDLGDVRRVELTGLSPDGRVWVLDVAAADRALPAVPDRRLPYVDLRGLRVVEGDEPVEKIVEVPFRVVGTVTEPASFVVTLRDWYSGETLPRRVVTLEPGQTSGTFPVSYLPDRRDDLPMRPMAMSAYALHDVMPGRYVALFRILDDDPTPRVTVRRPSTVVREGRRARWVVRLSAPVDYDLYVRAKVVAGSRPLPRLRAGDVPRAWLRDRVWPVPRPETPLFRTRVYLGGYLPQGTRRTVISIPVRRDGVREGREAVTLRVRAFRHRPAVERTVVVRDR